MDRKGTENPEKKIQKLKWKKRKEKDEASGEAERTSVRGRQLSDPPKRLRGGWKVG